MIEITQKQFFKVGFIVFIIIGASNLVTNFINWPVMIWSTKISSVAMNFFNFFIAFFFYSMYKGSNTKIEPIKEAEAEEIIEGLVNGN